ncbi:MAG: T9SS type A sorting domain-containing protein [Saprospiraceae bacterium]
MILLLVSSVGFTQKLYTPVYGEIQDYAETNQIGVFTFGYPTIDLIKNDGQGILTLGIPYPFGPVTSVHVSEQENPDGIAAYPNPATHRMRLTRRIADKSMDVRILSLDGRVINQDKWSSGQSTYELDVEDFPRGIYMIHVQADSGLPVTTLKLIRQ